MVNIKIPGGPPLSSSLFWSIYCLPPLVIPIMLNISSVDGRSSCLSSLFRSIYCLPPLIVPIMVNIVSFDWQWHFTHPCWCQYNLLWGLWQQYMVHTNHIHDWLGVGACCEAPGWSGPYKGDGESCPCKSMLYFSYQSHPAIARVTLYCVKPTAYVLCQINVFITLHVRANWYFKGNQTKPNNPKSNFSPDSIVFK